VPANSVKYAREWYLRNREKCIERAKAWSKANRVRARIHCRKWYASLTPEDKAAMSHKRARREFSLRESGVENKKDRPAFS
jgi:hypothetical protein